MPFLTFTKADKTNVPFVPDFLLKHLPFCGRPRHHFSPAAIISNTSTTARPSFQPEEKSSYSQTTTRHIFGNEPSFISRTFFLPWRSHFHYTPGFVVVRSYSSKKSTLSVNGFPGLFGARKALNMGTGLGEEVKKDTRLDVHSIHCFLAPAKRPTNTFC